MKQPVNSISDLRLESFIFLALFLFAVDFLDLSGILLAACICLFFFLNFSRKVEFDGQSRTLLVFSAFYFLSICIYEKFSVDGVIKYLLAPWGVYVLAYNFVGPNKNISAAKFVYIIAFGFFIHGMLNLYSSVAVYGINFSSNFRLARDFWQNRQISVTTAALYYSPFALMSMCCIFLYPKKWGKLISVIACGLSVFATLLYQNRTLLAAFGICIAVCTFLFFRSAHISVEAKKWIVTLGILAVILGIVFWFSDAFGIQSMLASTSLMQRVNGEGQDRTAIWLSFLFGDAWKYPLGGTKAVLLNNKPFVHNMWLDVFRRTGIVPFLTLLSFTVSSAKSLIAFSKAEDSGRGILVAVFMLSVAALCMVEPIIEANPYFFYIPLLTMGAVNGKQRKWDEATTIHNSSVGMNDENIANQ